MFVCWGYVLIVFLLYFPAIDANNSGEEEEVVRTRILFILLEFFLMELTKSRDKQANQGKPSIDL